MSSLLGPASPASVWVRGCHDEPNLSPRFQTDYFLPTRTQYGRANTSNRILRILSWSYSALPGNPLSRHFPTSPATALWTKSIQCIPGGGPAARESLGRLDIMSPIQRALVSPRKQKSMSTVDGKFQPPWRTCRAAITNGISWIVLELHCFVCDILEF
jgi:hypothetical protein